LEIKELLKKGRDLIKYNKYSSPNLEPIWVLSNLLNVDNSYIHTHLDMKIDKVIEERFIFIMKERKKGYPLQYLLNEQEFMGLNFYVEEGVLIPRSETEIMVEYIIDYINNNYKEKNINILDIGVGSGAISLSIAKEFPNIRVIGTDIGYIPIKVANINKENLRVKNVNFIQGDLFEALKSEDINKKFDIIISNPPYIKSTNINTLQKEVKGFEPKLALDGGKDGLDFYRKISKESKRYLNSRGMLIYEIGYDQGEDVNDILVKEGYSNIAIIKDLQKHDRIILGLKS